MNRFEILDSKNMTGRRIVDINTSSNNYEGFQIIIYVLDVHLIIYVLCKKKDGLESNFKVKCNMCNCEFKISTDKNGEDIMNINAAAVAGIMSIGGGFFNLEEFLSSLNVPGMSSRTYQKYHEIVSDGWKKTALRKMEESALKEAEYAKEINSVGASGIPIITVVAGGCWSKRSYKKYYNVLSGAAAIVGQRFGEVFVQEPNKKILTPKNMHASKIMKLDLQEWKVRFYQQVLK